MAITNLTGTSWQFGSELISDYATTFLYNIAWNYVIDYDNTTETGTNNVFPLASRESNYYFPYLMAIEHGSSNNESLTSQPHLYYGYRSAPKVKSNYYPNFVSFTVTFTGGADVTNANLIAWLEANATLVGEAPTATVITYNGSTIATLEAGQTATIKTAETEVEHDIIITPVFPIEIAYGDIIATANEGQTATIKCANTEADFDIVVSAKAEEYTVAGSWVVNDVPQLPTNRIYQQINLKDGMDYQRYGIEIRPDGISLQTTSGWNGAYYDSSKTWLYSYYQIWQFGKTPITVSAEFYEWLTANATLDPASII